MNIKVSIGEAIDKLSILELKQKKIHNEDKQKEIAELQECNKYKSAYAFYYKLLMYINEKIWDMTDIVKAMDIHNPEFAKVSNDIFEYNQKRFRIKNWFNLSATSVIREQKSYASTHCKIIIENESQIYDKIPEINYLLLEYDLVSFGTTPELEITIKNMFHNPTIVHNAGISECDVINISSYTLPVSIIADRQVFEFIPMIYINGGLLGDFIQSLSVVCENFYNSGRKGIIYISNRGDPFRNGLEQTYNDTYSTIIKQKYVNDYKIHMGEPYFIDLTAWRHLRNLNHNNWHHNYTMLYNIDWGKHKWMDVEYNDKWKNKIVVNTTERRWPIFLDFTLLYHKYKDDLIYISSDIHEYNIFCQKTNLQIEYYNITDFAELCSAIGSCKLFVGNLSAPLSIAHALNTNRICALVGGWDDPLNYNLDKIWSTLRYSV
jgi:hypothetical protein